jgi:predicted Ser/Thr protein kinase
MKFDIEPFKNIEFISTKSGLTSKVYIDVGKKYFVKIPVNELKFDILKREIHVLKLLNSNNISWCPKILYHNDKLFITNYCGERVNKGNIPADYKKQAQEILDDLKKLNIKHNDIKKEEILVKNNKIYLVDFGWASINDKFNCGINIDNREKQYIIHKDINLIKHLDDISK